MHNHKRLLPALAVTALASGTPLPGHAQDAFVADGPQPSRAPTVFYASPSGGADPPSLQGATMGTIGPPRADATVIQGVMTAGTVRVDPMSRLTNLPLHYLAVPVVAFALFLIVRRNRASIWEMGIVSSLILAATGVLFGTSLTNMFTF